MILSQQELIASRVVRAEGWGQETVITDHASERVVTVSRGQIRQ